MHEPAHPTANAALRATPALPVPTRLVLECLDAAERPRDAVFARAFDSGLTALEEDERGGALSGVTGHVAESVVEMVLAEHGWLPVWHFVGPGQHGVDLLMLGPGAERMFAVEVKGTLRKAWPRLRRGELQQMGVEWLDKSDNPAMHEWGVAAADLYGVVAAVNFSRRACKFALSVEFERWLPVVDGDSLGALDWLDAERGS